MRNISFSITTPQVRRREKDITRRMGWRHLKVGQRLCGVEKGMGLKPGEQIVRLCEIEVVSVTFEPLNRLAEDGTEAQREYGRSEMRREGFPDWSPSDFIAMFVRTHKGCRPNSEVTRIEFRYVDEGSAQ